MEPYICGHPFKFPYSMATGDICTLAVARGLARCDAGAGGDHLDTAADQLAPHNTTMTPNISPPCLNK